MNQAEQTTKRESLFSSWVRATGHNRRQVKAAGASLLGLDGRKAEIRNREIVSVPKIERLGLTAAFLGIPEWNAAFADASDEDLVEARVGAKLVREALERILARKAAGDLPEPKKRKRRSRVTSAET